MAPPVTWIWSSLLLVAVVACQVSCLTSLSAAVCSADSADLTVPQADSLVLMPACCFCSFVTGSRSTVISCDTMLLTSSEPPIAVIFAISTSMIPEVRRGFGTVRIRRADVVRCRAGSQTS